MNCRTNAAARPNTQLDSIFLHYERALCITGAFSIRVGVGHSEVRERNPTALRNTNCFSFCQNTRVMRSSRRSEEKRGRERPSAEKHHEDQCVL
ncbi:uncharacterized protein LOC143742373 isoform X2 [Siphateles boraxobius]|uniref:uncharacterized protein LOC143742373 isoform X2 n=1 Tax=Siphateles boraxobius TaxID=180520 RepID=UPI0040631FE8